MRVPLARKLIERMEGGRLSRLVNLTTEQVVNGRHVRIPLRGGVGFANLSLQERWLARVLPPLLAKKPGAFLDVGVNVGQTLLQIKTLAPDVAYIGFEPNAVCYAYTRELIRANGFHGCTLVPTGLSTAPAVVPLFARHDDDVSGSIVDGFRDAERYGVNQYVAVHSGDSVLETLGRPVTGTIKIDVEGAELEVVEGLMGTLARDRPFVLCEILPVFSESGRKGSFRRPRQMRLLDDMRCAGYRFYRVLEDASIVQMEEIAVHGDMALTNYLFVPSEDCAFVEGALGAQ